MSLLDIVQDGRTAVAFGYGQDRNPYIVATTDRAGARHDPPPGFAEKAAAWDHGWRQARIERAARSVLFGLDSPLDCDVRELMRPQIEALRAALPPL